MDGIMKEIKLTQDKVAKVDDEEFKELNEYKWRAHKDKHTYYAVRNIYEDGKQRTIRMHNAIMNTPNGMETDHRDGDGLNNQKYNLRNCTHAENGKNLRISESNTSGYKGVYWHKAAKAWVARIRVDYELLYLGCFETVEEGALAYNQKAAELYGEFARLNEIGQDKNNRLSDSLRAVSPGKTCPLA